MCASVTLPCMQCAAVRRLMTSQRTPPVFVVLVPRHKLKTRCWLQQ